MRTHCRDPGASTPSSPSTGASLRSEFQYRANVVTSIIGGLISQLTGFLVVWIIVDRFTALGGWTLPEITFLYGMRLTSHGIFYATISQLFELDRVLINGEFDRYLVRPASPLVRCSPASCASTASATCSAASRCLVAAGQGVDVTGRRRRSGCCWRRWSAGRWSRARCAALAVVTVVRFLNTLQVRVAANEIFNVYGNYPIRILSRLLQYLLTFALPVAFVAYLPASVILDKTAGAPRRNQARRRGARHRARPLPHRPPHLAPPEPPLPRAPGGDRNAAYGGRSSVRRTPRPGLARL